MSRPEPECDERCIYDYRAAERADSGTGDCDLCGVQHLFPQAALSITTRLMFARCLASVGRENRIFPEDREAAHIRLNGSENHRSLAGKPLSWPPGPQQSLAGGEV